VSDPTDLPEDPEAIFHLATPSQWDEAQATGSVIPPGFAAEGFVHCSTSGQLASTIERHFAGMDELVLLHLDPEAIASDLRWEEGRPGELFPHVYRPLVPGDLVAVIPWRRG
jgi:uncharacterized protein (DUF952 family)